MKRICKRCNIEKDIENFEQYSKLIPARRRQCKQCRRKSERLPKDLNPPRTYCSTCKDKLTNINKALDSKSPYGCRPQCKPCRQQKQQTHRLKNDSVQRNCIYCKVLFFRKTTARFRTCSDKCRVLSKIDKKSEQDCWPWKGFTTPTNNPLINIKNKTVSAIKLIYSYLCGPIKDKEYVIKSCFNNTCVNHNHFIKANRKEFINYQMDLFIKKKNINIKEIHNLYFKNKWSLRELSNKYNICFQTMHRIKDHKSIEDDIKIIETCINCQKQHDNIESEFCSPLCMQEFLLK